MGSGRFGALVAGAALLSATGCVERLPPRAVAPQATATLSAPPTATPSVTPTPTPTPSATRTSPPATTPPPVVRTTVPPTTPPPLPRACISDDLTFSQGPGRNEGATWSVDIEFFAYTERCTFSGPLGVVPMGVNAEPYDDVVLDHAGVPQPIVLDPGTKNVAYVTLSWRGSDGDQPCDHREVAFWLLRPPGGGEQRIRSHGIPSKGMMCDRYLRVTAAVAR